MSKQALDVAYYWSPNEAAAILDYLDRLRELVCELYGDDIDEWQREAVNRDIAHRRRRAERQHRLKFEDLEDWD